MTCNGICHRHKITKGKRNDSWYKQGAKRCSTCDIYIKWDGLWCPCCGYMLRNKPKNNQYKQRYNKNMWHCVNFGHYWTILDITWHFWHLWTKLDIFGHFWTFLDMLEKIIYSFWKQKLEKIGNYLETILYSFQS